MISNKRSEEMHDIIEKMPNKFGLVISGFVILLFCLIITLGFVISYPDTVPGLITIRKGALPIKLTTKNTGSVKLLKPLASNAIVHKGDYLLYFDNPTDVNKILRLKSILNGFVKDSSFSQLNKALGYSSHDYGELTPKVNQLQGIANKIALFHRSNIFVQQSKALNSAYSDQTTMISDVDMQIGARKRSLEIAKGIFQRDSVLYSKDLISSLEYEKSNQTYLAYQEALFNLIKEKTGLRQRQNDFQNQHDYVSVQKDDKYGDLINQFTSLFNDLSENIQEWEQKYVIVSPIDGRLEILKIVEDDAFIKAGEELFAVVPFNGDEVDGIIQILGTGAGKIHPDQKVIVKLENFPYKEFGYLTGTVLSIAKTPRTTINAKSQEENIYLVNVKFPKKIKTNYGSTLELKSGQIGNAEIITSNKQLISRVFQSVIYSANKN